MWRGGLFLRAPDAFDNQQSDAEPEVSSSRYQIKLYDTLSTRQNGGVGGFGKFN